MDELELIEFRYPSFFAPGTYIKVIKVVDERFAKHNPVGKSGIIRNHRMAGGKKWNRVAMDDGTTLDFLTSEIQKYDDD